VSVFCCSVVCNVYKLSIDACSNLFFLSNKLFTDAWFSFNFKITLFNFFSSSSSSLVNEAFLLNKATASLYNPVCSFCKSKAVWICVLENCPCKFVFIPSIEPKSFWNVESICSLNLLTPETIPSLFLASENKNPCTAKVTEVPIEKPIKAPGIPPPKVNPTNPNANPAIRATKILFISQVPCFSQRKPKVNKDKLVPIPKPIKAPGIPPKIKPIPAPSKALPIIAAISIDLVLSIFGLNP